MTRLTKLSSAAIISLAFCITGCSDEAEPEGGAKATPTDNGGGFVECGVENPFYAAEILQLIEVLAEATEGEAPGGLYSMPNHQSGFWDVPKAGYNQAQQEIGNTGNWEFPPAKTEPLEDIIAFQVEQLEAWTSDGVQGIALSGKSSTDLVAPVDAAIDAGIPVVTFDADVPDSKRHLYFGTLNVSGGETAAREMLRLLGSEEGTVLIMAGPQSEGSLQLRTEGIESTFEDEASTLDVVWDNTDDNLVENLDAAIERGGEDIVGVISLNGTFGPIVADYFKGRENSPTLDEVKIITWDITPQTQSAIQAGEIDAALAQRAFFYGYAPPYILHAMSVLGVDETLELVSDFVTDGDKIDTGLDVITTENLDDFSQYSSECLGVN